MICANCRTAIATRRYAYRVNGIVRIAALDDECAGKLTALGMRLRVEGRLDSTDTRPEWLRNRSAKDFTGSIA